MGEVGERWQEKGEKGSLSKWKGGDQTTVSEPDSQQTSFRTHLWKEGLWQLSREESGGGWEGSWAETPPGGVRVPVGRNW